MAGEERKNRERVRLRPACKHMEGKTGGFWENAKPRIRWREKFGPKGKFYGGKGVSQSYGGKTNRAAPEGTIIFTSRLRLLLIRYLIAALIERTTPASSQLPVASQFLVLGEMFCIS